MFLKKISIRNYKCFDSLDFNFNKYAAFVGENNSGKSAIFSAIDDFLHSMSKKTRISEDDFFIDAGGNRAKKLSIYVEFDNLSPKAIEDFREYTSTPTVRFRLDCEREGGSISSRVVGVRYGKPEFAKAFEAAKNSASDLNDAYKLLEVAYPDLPPMKEVSSKPKKLAALRKYEADRPDECSLLDSGDIPYGISGPHRILSKYFKWVLVPAVKNASDEASEGKNILAELVEYAARKQTNFDEKISEMEKKIAQDVSELRTEQQSALDTITVKLNESFEQISMGPEKVHLSWENTHSDLKISHPKAQAKIQSGSHIGPVEKFGHGLQRNYLVSLFRLITEISPNEENDYHLVIGFEEPELYQHPPQARLLAKYLQNLSKHDQVLITTHSPIFINEDIFGQLHVVRNQCGKTDIHSVSLEMFSKQMSELHNLSTINYQSSLASLSTLLSLNVSEVFFSKLVILVEGHEDIGYLKGAIDSYGYEEDFLRYGYNIVPTMGKNELIPVIELCKAFKIPYFAIFDADSEHQTKSKELKENTEKNNQTLFSQLGIIDSSPFPKETILSESCCIWPDNIRASIKSESPKFEEILTEANQLFGGSNKRPKTKNPKVTYYAISTFKERYGDAACLINLLEQIKKKMQLTVTE